jgi:hypothetical protein
MDISWNFTTISLLLWLCIEQIITNWRNVNGSKWFE